MSFALAAYVPDCNLRLLPLGTMITARVSLLGPCRRCGAVRANQKHPNGPAVPQGPHCLTPVVRASRIPTPDEDKEVAHSAFLSAFQSAQPEVVRIHGMQEFASAVSPPLRCWDRAEQLWGLVELHAGAACRFAGSLC